MWAENNSTLMKLSRPPVKIDQRAAEHADSTSRNLRLPRQGRHARIVGTLLGISPSEALLWTHGSVDDIGPRHYFQGSRSTPRPLRLVRHAGHGSCDDSAFAILALSKMDWNNDALYDPLPATLEYAKILARVVKRVDVLGSAPYQSGFFV